MARTLLLFRHAKSGWDEPGLSDFERPLAPRGIKAARRMAGYLHDKGRRPDLVLCSAARRALETWRLAAPVLAPDCPVKVLRSLYLAPPSRLLAAIGRAPDEAETLMVVGHNPGIAHLAAILAGPGSHAKALKRLEEKFPTAAVAAIAVSADGWSTCGEGAGRLQSLVRPKDL